jgi:hypothetical protein
VRGAINDKFKTSEVFMVKFDQMTKVETAVGKAQSQLGDFNGLGRWKCQPFVACIRYKL